MRTASQIDNLAKLSWMQNSIVSTWPTSERPRMASAFPCGAIYTLMLDAERIELTLENFQSAEGRAGQGQRIDEE